MPPLRAKHKESDQDEEPELEWERSRSRSRSRSGLSLASGSRITRPSIVCPSCGSHVESFVRPSIEMEGLSAKMGGLELEAEAEVQDYGLPKDHPFTQPGDRIPIPMKLKSADNYKSAGGQLVTAPEDCYRTCASDPDPVVATFDGVISPEECAAVIALAQPKMSRAGVTTDDGRGGRQSSGRTNDSTWLPHDCSPTMWKVVQRISDLVGIPSENAEDVQVIHYTDGQEYRKHWDAYNPLNERGRRATASGGNRLITALAYLSEVEEGGGTGFINLRMEVDARAGRLLVFHNCYPGTRTLHVDSNHAGLPVVSGDKWAFNLW